MILVTGATGNVGRNVVLQLLEPGEKVRASTLDPATANLPGPHAPFTMVWIRRHDEYDSK